MLLQTPSHIWLWVWFRKFGVEGKDVARELWKAKVFFVEFVLVVFFIVVQCMARLFVILKIIKMCDTNLWQGEGWMVGLFTKQDDVPVVAPSNFY